MCQKRQRRCPVARQYQELAYAEWEVAETLPQVRAAWGRYGGRMTMHRYGREHFAELARRRRHRAGQG